MFDWEIRISDFEIAREIRKPQKTDFASEKSVLMEDFNQEIQIRISWISFVPFDWEIQKRIFKTILVNSGLRFANYQCVCKTAVLKNCLSIPLSDFPKTKTPKEWESKSRYLSAEIRFRFHVRLLIRNPEFKI